MARPQPAWLSAIAVAVFLIACGPAAPIMAQDTTAQGAGAKTPLESELEPEVKTKETVAASSRERLLAAIARAAETTAEVAKVYNLDELEIVFVPDLGEGGSEADDAIEANKDAIADMRKAIQGNAMFYHALDDRQVLIDRVVAVEFADDERVTVFVAGKDPNG